MTVKKGGTSHFSAVSQHSSSQMSVIALINSHSFVSLSSTERSTSCSGCVLEKPFILCLSFAQSKSTISVVTPPSSSSCCVVRQRIHTHTHTHAVLLQPPAVALWWKIFLVPVTVMLIIYLLFVCSSDTCCSSLVFSLLCSIFHANGSASILSHLHSPTTSCQNIIFYHLTPLHLCSPPSASLSCEQRPL